MNRLKHFFSKNFISHELTFESRTLNFVCFFSAIAGSAALISRLVAGLPFVSAAPLLLMVAAIVGVLLMSVYRAKYTAALTTLIVGSVSVIFWPLLFFTVGGPDSGMAVYFALAIILDFTLLKGVTRTVALVLTSAITVACYVSTLFLGISVLPENGLTTYQLFVDTLQSIFIVGFLMGIIILFQAKLYQNEKSRVDAGNYEIKRSKELLAAINEAAIILLSAEYGDFKEKLSESMEKVAVCIDIDCIYIYRADDRDESRYALLYEWLSPHMAKTEKTAASFPRSAEWDGKLLGECGYMSETTDSFTGDIKEALSFAGIKSIMAFPVFFQGRYWGFVSFGGTHDGTLCSGSEIPILQSGSLLFVNAVERKESMKHLESAQLTVSAMFESNPHMNILFDSSFKVVDCNPAAVKFMGFDSEEEMLAGFMERITKAIPPYQPNGQPSVPLAERFMTVVKEGAVQFETEIVLGGARRNLDVQFRRIPYNNSFAIVAHVFDMTPLHRREMELKQAQLTVSAMFESNPHMNILFDSSFRVIDCNPAAVRFMGFDSKEEMIAGFAKRLVKSVPQTLSSGRPTRSISEYFTTAVNEGLVNVETEFVLGGQTRNVNIELKRIPYGDSFAIVGYILDMTEVREREMELKRRDLQLSKAVEAAEAANKAKSSFLSTMSHEIRTPMNAILGITEIQLQNETLDQSVQEALGKIYVSSDLLLGIINDILDLSKIEAGKLELTVDKYEIASVVSDTAQLNMMRIGSKPIEFELYIDENLPAYLFGDELRIKQILNNILSNAFKYTDSGTVKLSISAEKDNSEDSISLVLKVSDTGQGMTKEQVDKLFDEYSRFNAEANRSTEGTGLGMSITRNLVRLMDGKIEIESEVGKGSTFTIRLPQKKAGSAVLGKELVENLHQFRTSSRAQMKRTQIAREPMPYGSVLIVDDVETNIYVAKGLLSPYGLKIESAESGYAAVEKIKHGSSYDVIFMDHMMPRMDGIEATKIIRDMGYGRPIVALTANAVSGQADIFLGNGFDDFISKPIDVRQLNAVLNKMVRDKQPPEVIEAARNRAKAKSPPSDAGAPQALNPKFAEIFARDASKSIAALEAIDQKGSYADEDDMRTYTIHVHGMKSALANIKKMELSAVALKLETSARDGNIELIASETPAFLNSLKTLVEELQPKESESADGANGEDRAYLLGKLSSLKAACEAFGKKAAREIVAELKEKARSQRTKELTEAISEKLLHSDFEEIIAIVDKFTGEL